MREKLVKLLCDNNTFALTKANKLKISGENRVITPEKVLKTLSPETLISYEILEPFYKLSARDRTLEIEASLEEIEKGLKKRMKLNSGLAEEHFSENVIYCVNYYDGTDKFITDKKYNVLDIDSEAWKSFIPKEEFDLCEKAIIKKEYNPYEVYKVQKTSNYTILNLCEFPPYRFGLEDVKEFPELNPLFNKLLDHLFKTKESHDYTMSWYLSAIHGRNQVGLTFIGNRGIGKSKLCETFPRMFGFSNFKLGDPKALEKEFNAFLDKSRLVLFDEVAITSDEEMTRMKKYFNENNSIEKKGKDAETKPIHCSYVFSTNYLRNIKILSDERRFSCVDLNEEKLLKSMTAKEIGQLELYINHDPEFPLAFYGYMLKHQIPNVNHAIPFKGKTFYEAVEANLTKWERSIFEKIEQGVTGNFTLEETDFDWNEAKGRPDTPKIKNFLANFEYKGVKLGSLDKARTLKKSTIVVNPELIRKDFKSEL